MEYLKCSAELSPPNKSLLPGYTLDNPDPIRDEGTATELPCLDWTARSADTITNIIIVSDYVANLHNYTTP